MQDSFIYEVMPPWPILQIPGYGLSNSLCKILLGMPMQLSSYLGGVKVIDIQYLEIFALTEHQPDEIASYESQTTGYEQLHLNHNEMSELSPTMNLLPLGRAIPS